MKYLSNVDRDRFNDNIDHISAQVSKEIRKRYNQWRDSIVEQVNERNHQRFNEVFDNDPILKQYEQSSTAYKQKLKEVVSTFEQSFPEIVDSTCNNEFLYTRDETSDWDEYKETYYQTTTIPGLAIAEIGDPFCHLIARRKSEIRPEAEPVPYGISYSESNDILERIKAEFMLNPELILGVKDGSSFSVNQLADKFKYLTKDQEKEYYERLAEFNAK